jgi:Flp pilus assembly protein TadB
MRGLAVAIGGGLAGLAFVGLVIARRRSGSARRLQRINRRHAAPESKRPNLVEQLGNRVADRPWAWLAGMVLGATAIGLVLSGAVAAVIGALYVTIALRFWRRRVMRGRTDVAYDTLLARVDAAVSDLRAGLLPEALLLNSPPIWTGEPSKVWPVNDRATAVDDGRDRRSGPDWPVEARSVDLAGSIQRSRWAVFDEPAPKSAGSPERPSWTVAPDRTAVDDAVARAVDRLEAAYRISEALGAPLADLLDKVDADLREGRRLRQSLSSETAGVQATSAVLGALPLFGVGLGYAMNTDPLHQLLHTPAGAVCGILAVLLQCAGFLWTGRIVAGAFKGVT